MMNLKVMHWNIRSYRANRDSLKPFSLRRRSLILEIFIYDRFDLYGQWPHSRTVSLTYNVINLSQLILPHTLHIAPVKIEPTFLISIYNTPDARLCAPLIQNIIIGATHNPVEKLLCSLRS